MVNPIASPSDSDWIVCITHSGGIVSKFRVAPGTVTRECAAGRAMRAGRIQIATVTDLTVVRAADHVRVADGDYESQLRAMLDKKRGTNDR